MKKINKILLFVVIIAIAFLIKAEKCEAYEYIWPVGGNNANETYKDYDFFGKAYTAPYKDGKSGREYIVNNTLWPDEKYFYAKCESHYGMDITGINGQTYKVVSVCDGIVIATSENRAKNPSVNYAERNQRRTSAGLNDGGGYGNYVIIQDPLSGRCFLYAHLRGGTVQVKKGDSVKAGQEIATMGSSGDSGHMHLHFEIRANKESTVNETSYGYHYLVNTNSNTNLDPEVYIGSKPDVHTPYEDDKIVKISKEDAKLYVRYLYSTALKREASADEAEVWANRYIETGSIYDVTFGIFNSQEFKDKNGELGNLDFIKKTYEIILFRGNNYGEQEMSGHLDRLDRGVWTREDYLRMLCNCQEFVGSKCNAIIEKVKADDQKRADEQKKKDEEEAKKKEAEAKKVEIENVELYVRYLYRKALGRNPMKSEVEHWVGQYNKNKSIEELTKAIFINVETESMSNSDFMKKVAEVLFNNDSAHASVIETYSGLLESGDVTKSDFIVSVCNTPNFKDNMYQALVNMQKIYEEERKNMAIAPENKLSKLGDLDGDGKISAIDASLCMKLYSLSDRSGYEYAVKYADVNENGKLEYEDALKILDYYVQMMVKKIDENTTMEEFVKI